MRHTAHMKNLVFPLPVGQNRKMNQAGDDSHRIHLPHQGADPFFIPKDIGEIGELAPYIMVRDAQVVPIFMPSGEDVEVSPPPIDLSFIPSVPRAQQDDLPRPGLLAGTAFQDTGIIHVPFLLSEIMNIRKSYDLGKVITLISEAINIQKDVKKKALESKTMGRFINCTLFWLFSTRYNDCHTLLALFYEVNI